MKMTIVQKSSLDQTDNWSAEFNIYGKSIIDSVLRQCLDRSALQAALKEELRFVRIHCFALNMSINHKKTLISALIGGSGNKQSVDIFMLIKYIEGSINLDRARMIKALILSIVLKKAVEENKLELEKYIESELKKILDLRKSLDQILSIN